MARRLAQRPGALPSWYLVSTADRAIAPDLKRFMAGRMGAAKNEVAARRASPVFHPHEIAELIFAAARFDMRA